MLPMSSTDVEGITDNYGSRKHPKGNGWEAEKLRRRMNRIPNYSN